MKYCLLQHACIMDDETIGNLRKKYLQAGEIIL